MDGGRSGKAALSRRELLKGIAAVAAGTTTPGARSSAERVDPASDRANPSPASARRSRTVIDPTPLYALSPNLYMQMMEPLGATDSSVEAAWDHRRLDWREDLVEAMSELAPPMLRWGGLFADYYHWREGVGPRVHLESPRQPARRRR